MSKRKKDALWYDRKRTFLGLPLSFTKYYLYSEKLVTEAGFLNLKEEEVRLYRILDVSLRRSLGQRIFGLGTIHICSADKSTPEFDLKSIKKSNEIKDMLSNLVESARESKRISGREYMGGGLDDEGFDHEH